jgi:Predicted AAA-ATPase/PD-(D/E)XK nuclease superfamily
LRRPLSFVGKRPACFKLFFDFSLKKTYFYAAKQQRMIKIPYGKSDFKGLITGGFYYVDRTSYIRNLENLGNSYLFFLRPRRFGKSLWISILRHYYGEEHRSDFQALFGKTDIGQKPTPLANTYLVLRLEFSRIDTQTEKSTRYGFLSNIWDGAHDFFLAYPGYFHPDDFQTVRAEKTPVEAIKTLFQIVKAKAPGKKIYLLIDEYDHFANELIAFDLERFKKSVSQNGWVRKFYEAIKEATASGLLERMFITGVSPLTLDSLTSGFNIGTHISLNRIFHDMMGFTESDVRVILAGVGIAERVLGAMLNDMKAWYNGYMFHHNAQNRLYNPDMVLYFAEEYRQVSEYPERMLDINISSDYGKIRGMFGVGDKAGNYAILVDLLGKNQIAVRLTPQFSFTKDFTSDDFVSLLFYLGLLTIDEVKGGITFFRIPNYVIQELYFNYFLEVNLQRAEISAQTTDTTGAIYALAYENNPRLLVELAERILKGLSDRDALGFDEKHIKIIFASLIYPVGQFFIKSEYPVEGGYIDLLLLQHPAHKPHRQFAIELKYLPKGKADQLESKVREAVAQLNRYRSDDYLCSLDQLHAWAIVFVGDEAKYVQELNEQSV